jgi:predicted aminopeptidase
MGCQAGYLVENAYYQADLLLSRQANVDALNSDKLDEKQKKKIRLAEQAREFAERKLGLTQSENYTQFVELDGKYVVHSLTVAPKYELQPYKWWFPFFGSFPYLGYFNEESARRAQKKFDEHDYDTYLRGVSAFSTLGWFKDPILSSLLRYSDYDLVNTIIHETVHATIYIKSAVEFNERLAVFVANIGTEKFYLEKEGADSKTLKMAADENTDDKLFSQFISKELGDLEKWYAKHKDNKDESARQARLKEIQANFTERLAPQLKTKTYKWFPKAKLNNARLLNYRTYMKDLSDFDKLYELLGRDFAKLIAFCKSLESEDDPEAALKKKVL